MDRSLRLAKINEHESGDTGEDFPTSADVRELAHRLYEQRDTRQARSVRPQPALDWFLSLVFRPEPDQNQSDTHRIRRAA